MRIESAKHQAERECTEVKRREDSAKPNPKGAQASARSPLCNPSEFSSKHPLKTTCRNVLRPSFSRARCISELKKWVNSRVICSRAGCMPSLPGLQIGYALPQHDRPFHRRMADASLSSPPSIADNLRRAANTMSQRVS